MWASAPTVVLLEGLMRFGRSFFFVGNKERLQKTVQRANGKMLSEQRFSVLVYDKSIQQRGLLRDAYGFRFYCRFQKKENGYEIRYFVTPTCWTLARTMVVPALLWLALHQESSSIYLAGFVLLLLLVNLVRQGVHCAEQFEEMCEK